LFKSAAEKWHVDGWTWASVTGFLSPMMIVALTVYGLTTLLWVFVLRSVPLSVAYSVFSLAYVLVPVLAYFVLGEEISANTIVGGAIIMIGIFVVVR
jgi:undecaprenyl phosphate-alpha-L-ara4N flippase subunit ArnE